MTYVLSELSILWGRQIAGGYKEGITPLVDKEDHKMSL